MSSLQTHLTISIIRFAIPCSLSDNHLVLTSLSPRALTKMQPPKYIKTKNYCIWNYCTSWWIATILNTLPIWVALISVLRVLPPTCSDEYSSTWERIESETGHRNQKFLKQKSCVHSPALSLSCTSVHSPALSLSCASVHSPALSLSCASVHSPALSLSWGSVHSPALSLSCANVHSPALSRETGRLESVTPRGLTQLQKASEQN